MRVDPDRSEFGSPEELAALLEAIGLRLHGKNRIAMGEQVFAWELAELIRRIGSDLVPLLDDHATRAAFGDGCTPGRLDKPAQRAGLIGLAFPGR